MSRIGKLPIGIPKGVTVSVDDHTVKVKGPKGELTRRIAADIAVAVEDDTIKVSRPSDEPRRSPWRAWRMREVAARRSSTSGASLPKCALRASARRMRL